MGCLWGWNEESKRTDNCRKFSVSHWKTGYMWMCVTVHVSVSVVYGHRPEMSFLEIIWIISAMFLYLHLQSTEVLAKNPMCVSNIRVCDSFTPGMSCFKSNVWSRSWIPLSWPYSWVRPCLCMLSTPGACLAGIPHTAWAPESLLGRWTGIWSTDGPLPPRRFWLEAWPQLLEG